MKQLFFKAGMAAFIFSVAAGMTSCKTKVKETTTPTVNVDSTNAIKNAPVVVTPDETLMQGVKDATKDFPGVTASVVNGEIILNGTIERSNWQRLNPILQSLNPKKVNSDQLIIK